ncbi:MAG: 30S ribosome-binding factor RbfA [Leptospirillia bacterium]
MGAIALAKNRQSEGPGSSWKRKGYRRYNRVGDVLRETVADAIERLIDDPRVGFVTVTRVEAAPDLKTAKVYVSVLTGDPDDAVSALTDTAHIIQREIARRVRIMWTPKLRFILDQGAARADRITRLINDGRPDSDPDTK